MSKVDPAQPKARKCVIVVRHGERLDYVMRDRGENWVQNAERPWDPPLTDHGQQQALELGKALPILLRDLQLPNVGAIYSSPFYRCRQTAVGLWKGYNGTTGSDDSKVLLSKVRVEVGLVESINQNWYRSWAVEGTDGTWGYGKKQGEQQDTTTLDPATLHPSSKQPVQTMLDWTTALGDEELEKWMDRSYVSKSAITNPYSLHPPLFENYNKQRDRMHQTLNGLLDDNRDQSIVLVSHGGPVTHLFESLTGKNWKEHGMSEYCCYSVYQLLDNEDTWTPLLTNKTLWKEEAEQTERKSFAWQ